MTRKAIHGNASSTRRGKHRSAPRSSPTLSHPRSVPILASEPDSDQLPEQPFAEGVRDELDPALRYRMISERAYHRYVDRGYADGADLDDWLQAEADVDHLLLGETMSASGSSH